MTTTINRQAYLDAGARNALLDAAQDLEDNAPACDTATWLRARAAGCSCGDPTTCQACGAVLCTECEVGEPSACDHGNGPLCVGCDVEACAGCAHELTIDRGAAFTGSYR